MEKSPQPSFLKTLALAFGDGLMFGVAMKLAQGPSRSRENEMTDLGPLAERLRKVEQHIDHPENQQEALVKFSDGLDGRVLEKVIVALEARLTEHIGQVDRRIAEIDAQVALDLKAVDSHTTAQSGAVEKAIQALESQVREYVAESHQHNSDQIAEVDQRLTALHEALPAKFREIIEAVRQSMEARVALQLTEVENRFHAGVVTPDRLAELETRLRGEVQSQAEPLQQALQQLENKLSTLRDELPPKIRQIVETVESAMTDRIAAGSSETAERISTLEGSLASVREDLAQAAALRPVIHENLRRHAEQVSSVEQRLTQLQEELPPKIKAIVDAVRESLDARFDMELKRLDEQHQAQLREAESRAGSAHQESYSGLQSNLTAVSERLAAGERKMEEISSLDAQRRTDIEEMESRLAGEIRALEGKIGQQRPPELDKALQYASLLESRVQALENRLQHASEDAAERATERIWQMLEVRLQQQAAAPAQSAPAESISGLRQRSTSAEQNVMDLIAGIGQLFERPAAKPVRETPSSPEAQATRHEPPQAAVSAPPAAPANSEPAAMPAAEAASAPPRLTLLTEPPHEEAEAEAPAPAEAGASTEAQPDDKAPVILFKPKEPGRKWRIPFVSSFLLMAAALAWLQFM